MPNIRFLFLFALSLCMALSLPLSTAQSRSGGPSPEVVEVEPSEDKKAIQLLRRQIAAEQLAGVLQLSDSQAADVIVIIQEVQAHKRARREQRQRGETHVRALLEDYLDQVQRSGEADEQTIADLKELRQANRAEPGQGRANRREVRERLRSILTEQQISALRSFRPMAGLRGDKTGDRGHKRARRDSEGVQAEDSRGAYRQERQQAKTGRQGKKKKRIARVLMSDEMLAVLSR
jgi:hypothetical protein